MVADSEIQRIARLTPLADVLASFDLSIGPVQPREEAVSKALGLTLAASAVIAVGVERVLVRQPRVRVVRSGVSEIIRGAATLIASAVDSESGTAVTGDTTLEAALNDDSADIVVAIGGTGSGRNDESVRTLARVGKVQFHGVGITPGETTALGFAGTRPVLLLPRRIDAAPSGLLI